MVKGLVQFIYFMAYQPLMRYLWPKFDSFVRYDYNHNYFQHSIAIIFLIAIFLFVSNNHSYMVSIIPN